ncbi:hypothetical protein [Psychrosphaera algicola]|uniref:Uncharacterized protein n=1 Tax=Psychrosphaera algicola TaxID=3023714 RepID=A0ABT5FIH2_9GAMM|nr:hypothetical protein [Psychrosphaera sp. G1-22]MDC2890988.1 hypothetical protein [Psychrosphaera sp. G1-22]
MVDAVEIAARRAKKGAACKAKYDIPLHLVGDPKYRLGSFGMTFFCSEIMSQFRAKYDIPLHSVGDPKYRLGSTHITS